MKTRLLTVCTSKFDPIAKAIDQSDIENVDILCIKDIIDNVDINDYCDTNKTEINWYYNNKHISNDQNTILLSRITSMPLELFDEFNEDDKVYALCELQAYLGFSLNAFKHLNYYIGPYALESCNSLPFQWEHIKKKISISTPKYYWGDNRYSNLNEDSIVYSEIYDYTNWKPNNKPVDKRLIFCFRRPKGKPIFAASLGDNILITPHENKNEITFPEKRIKDIAIDIAKSFNLFISETLFFYDEKNDNLSFAFSSPFINYSHNNERFNNFVSENLNKYLEVA